MKILVATDGSECSRYAISNVAGRPWPAESEFRVVFAVDAYPVAATEAWAVPPSTYADLETALRDRAKKALEEAAELLREGGAGAVTTEVLVGPAKRAILDEAEQWGADLIVVGSHGYGAVARFFLGSVSHAIAVHAHCSVEIVRQKG
jgi:nucleotide-binding universal stress UspA family protein